MPREHDYTARVVWTGNRGEGTAHYKSYDRTWNVETPDKPVIHCSNDPLLGGDPTLHNPEDMLIAALSACHMLWFLHLASDAGIIVHAYQDDPLAVGETDTTGASRFLRATLRPSITVPAGTDLKRANALHGEIHKTCFIARSVNFPVTYEPRYRIQG
ncbi:Organic hydroperoxide reductase OsmC/OhrA [Roseovarius lutimaris]|uniref:Organic hydroperoxide reductase OsmC/OhrA n=1 Tax=Roseovarius lutimaris TaxID=1005928 RepID=A0A1I5DMZ5_9RHOB|nr:OsmC family protein [Roseovarius lutimaris]SFO00527.1 Organic hydroperoxide reductase OsmC/OhrA [Roseovarius lutimaris]